MPAVMAPEVLADPIGVVADLVLDIESALAREVIAETVERVAGGRAKRRRLAQALVDKPALLTEGRSPAPRVVGDLLIALRKAGAAGVAPPACAECGKHLRCLQRRGEDWYCAVCGPRPRRCSFCGQDRIVAGLDRQGRPRCGQCPDHDGRDPLAILCQVITRLEPSLTAEAITAAARRVHSRPAKLLQLAWAIEDTPTLLTGQAAQAPMPSVLRLIDELRGAGAQRITRPACPRCHRIVRLHRRIGRLWLCRNCVAKSQAQPCSRCGAVREAATRDEHGNPLCPYCLTSDPANHETCIACGRRRPVSVRTPDGPLCPTCRPHKTLDCAICGRTAACTVSTATGQPWCLACQKRWARCTGCGNVRPVRGGTAAEPVCATCARPDPAFWRMCPTCGQNAQLRSGPCIRCTVRQRLHDLLADRNGTIRPDLQALYDNLANYERPNTVLGWLGKSTAPAILRELGTGTRPLTHAALDQLPDGKPIEHLRSVLVATNALPARDEHIARLEHWITRVIAERADPDEQHLLRRYALWHLLRRLRRRLNDATTTTTYDQAVAVRQHVKAALTLLDWLTAQNLTLSTDVRIRLSREPVLLPEPLAGLILELAASRRGHAALGDQGTSPWLFPGGQPGRPISAFRMAERLRQLGIRSGQSRSTALFQLATELPAALLARMLGIHISVAVAWQRASAGDWMTHAADYSRRTRDETHQEPTDQAGD